MNRWIETDKGLFNLDLIIRITNEEGDIRGWDVSGEEWLIISDDPEIYWDTIKRILALPCL